MQSEDQTLSKAMERMKAGDAASALQLLLPLAEKGNPQAQHGVGFIISSSLHRCPNFHEQPEILDQWFEAHKEDLRKWAYEDIPEAIKWYTRASENGFASSSFMLAQLYAEHYTGDHTWEEISSQAKKYFAKAEEQGFYMGDYWRKDFYWEEMKRRYEARFPASILPSNSDPLNLP